MSLAIALAVGVARPYDGPPPPWSWWPWRDRVVTVYACLPPKDQARLPQGLLTPKVVPTERIVAADYPAVSQAREQKKKRR